MKGFIHFICLLLTLIPLSVAQGMSLSSALEAMPSCALQCLSTAQKASPCAPTNQTCICADEQLQESVEACVLQHCTIRQSLTTKNITMTTCGAPIRNKSIVYKVTGITLGVLSAVMVLIRIGYKSFVTVSELGWDDYFIVITLFVGLPGTIINDRGTIPNGLGRDIWTLDFTQINDFLRWFFVMEVLYFSQVFVLKLSLLFFYERIFTGARVHKIILATIVFDVLYGIAFVVAAIIQCRPISYYWTSWDGEHKGHCIDINALGWSNAAISIALDIWMLAIPLSQLAQLNLAWKKKVGVAMMFCVGTFVTIVSILRLQSLVHFANSTNPTWDQKDVNNWSMIEINVGIMCACMPALRVVLVRMFPKVLGTTHNPSIQDTGKYGTQTGYGTKRTMESNPMRNGADPESNAANGITFTKTFEVEHGVKEIDEVGLMEMNNLSRKSSHVKSGNSSQVSL